MFHLSTETSSYLFMLMRMWILYQTNISVTKTKYFNDKMIC